MTTSVQDNSAQSRYEIHVDETLAGYLDYEVTDGVIALTHTIVEDDSSGKGLARVLVEHALTDARERGLSVRPVCPYVTALIAKAPDTWLDLVRPEDRAAFDLPTD